MHYIYMYIYIYLYIYILYGKAISEYMVKWGGWSKTANFGCFFIWSTNTNCIEETDFGQLITSLSNENENQLWYNCTVKSQTRISLAYSYLNSFMLITILTHEEKLGLC